MRVLHTIVQFTLAGIFCLYSLCASAQNQQEADSLIRLVQQQEFSDSVLYKLYCDIAQNSTIPQQALSYSTKAIDLAQEKQLKVSTAIPLLLKGYALMQQGNLAAATEDFYTSAKLYQQKNNLSGVATAYAYLAQAYRMQDHQEQSTRYYLKSIDILKTEEILKTRQDSVRLSSSLLNLGYQYYKMQKPDSGLIYTREAEEIFEALRYDQYTAYALGNAGLMHAALGRDSLAEQNLQRALTLLTKYDDNYAISEYQTEMAAIYQSRGAYEQALRHAEKGYALAETHHFLEMLRDASLRLSEIYSLRKDFEKAFRFQKEYMAYRDSINNDETIRKMADLRTEFEVAQKQKDIDLLEENARTQRLMMLGLLVIVLLFLLLIFSLYYYYRQKQQSNKLLARQNEELAHQRHQLEVLNNTRNRFFSIISHDLRGPVNAFNGISQLIQHYIATQDLQQLSEISRHMDKSASQLSALLDNLLSWSVLQQGDFPYRPERIELSRLMLDVMEIFKTMAQAKNIRLEPQLESPLYLQADSNSLRTVFRNLISNALKFTPAGGAVVVSSHQLGDIVEIQIRDTGIGMSQERVNGLFALQEEKRTWGTAGEKGLGIGLRLVHDFILMNNGQIQVHSQEGVGTTFTILLPSPRSTTTAAFQKKLSHL